MESNWRWNVWKEGFAQGVWSLAARILGPTERLLLKQEPPAFHNWAIYKKLPPLEGWVFEQQETSALPFPFGFNVEPDHP